MQNKALKGLCVPRHSVWNKVFPCLWILLYLSMIHETFFMYDMKYDVRALGEDSVDGQVQNLHCNELTSLYHILLWMGPSI